MRNRNRGNAGLLVFAAILFGFCIQPVNKADEVPISLNGTNGSVGQFSVGHLGNPIPPSNDLVCVYKTYKAMMMEVEEGKMETGMCMLSSE